MCTRVWHVCARVCMCMCVDAYCTHVACVCVGVHVLTRVHTRVMCVRAGVHVCTLCVHVHACTHVHMSALVCVLCTCMCACVHVYGMRLFRCVCVHACVPVCIGVCTLHVHVCACACVGPPQLRRPTPGHYCWSRSRALRLTPAGSTGGGAGGLAPARAGRCGEVRLPRTEPRPLATNAGSCGSLCRLTRSDTPSRASHPAAGCQPL